MKRLHRFWLVCGGVVLVIAPATAQAHVRYRDLDTPPVLLKTTYGGSAITDPCEGKATGCQSSNAFTTYGWLKGTEATLGNSHYLTLNAEFWKFHLNEASTVTITFTQGQAGIDPAFSVYAGLLPSSAHDDTTVDPLNPVGTDGCSVASPVDAHPSPYTYLPHDGYRDTLAFSTTGGTAACVARNPFFGQFEAFASWSMANPSGAWSRIQFVASVAAATFSGNDGGLHVAGNHDTAAGIGETLTLDLDAGDYTIAAGGEHCSTTDGACGAVLYGSVAYTRGSSDGGSPVLDGGGTEDGGDGGGADAGTGSNAQDGANSNSSGCDVVPGAKGVPWLGAFALGVLALMRRRRRGSMR